VANQPTGMRETATKNQCFKGYSAAGNKMGNALIFY
jgi:hypothetical protein